MQSIPLTSRHGYKTRVGLRVVDAPYSFSDTATLVMDCLDSQGNIRRMPYAPNDWMGTAVIDRDVASLLYGSAGLDSPPPPDEAVVYRIIPEDEHNALAVDAVRPAGEQYLTIRYVFLNVLRLTGVRSLYYRLIRDTKSDRVIGRILHFPDRRQADLVGHTATELLKPYGTAVQTESLHRAFGSFDLESRVVTVHNGQIMNVGMGMPEHPPAQLWRSCLKWSLPGAPPIAGSLVTNDYHEPAGVWTMGGGFQPFGIKISTTVED